MGEKRGWVEEVDGVVRVYNSLGQVVALLHPRQFEDLRNDPDFSEAYIDTVSDDE